MATPPVELRWLFWELDFESLEVERDADSILARVLEHGRMADVNWAVASYGLQRIHRFFREVGHPDVSERTRKFWRAVLHASEEQWAELPSWRRNSSAPWID